MVAAEIESPREVGRALEAVLFDMDGTLVDTEPIWIEAEKVYAKERGASWTTEDAIQCVGRPLIYTAEALVERTGSEDSPEEVMEYLINYLRREVQSRPVAWMPGMEQLISTLKGEGIPVALVTSSYRPIVEALSSQIGENVLQATVTASDVENMKPHPEPYLQAASLLGVEASRCVAIEDSPSGLQSALASGAAVIGIPGVVPMPKDPRISRVPSAEALNLDLLRRVASGEKIDLLVGDGEA